jgi:hypothetical protein
MQRVRRCGELYSHLQAIRHPNAMCRVDRDVEVFDEQLPILDRWDGFFAQFEVRVLYL